MWISKELQLSPEKAISAHNLETGFATEVLKNEYINKYIADKLSNATNAQIYQFGTVVVAVVSFFFSYRAHFSDLAFFTSSF